VQNTPRVADMAREMEHPIGVLMLDTRFPRLLGDVGNTQTWPFPVLYRVVHGAHPERMAQSQPDPSLLEPFIEAARRLETSGVRAITTSCGFLAANQIELMAAVSVPVFTSALLQVPLAAQMCRPNQVVAILTAREALTERHFNGAGFSAKTTPVVQAAPPADSHFVTTFVGDAPTADVDQLKTDVARLAEKVIQEHPVGAIVLECANLSPFVDIVRRIANVAVFDLYTLGMAAYLSTLAEPHSSQNRQVVADALSRPG
jgi:hypothetical protein